MNIERKQQITTALEEYVNRSGGQNAAANTLTGVSNATISQMLNRNWDAIAPAMWISVEKQIGATQRKWNIAETSVYKKINVFFADAQRHPNGIRAIIAPASTGKSTAVNAYCDSNETAYYIRCHRHMPARILLRDMLKSMGKDSSGTLTEKLENLVKYILRDNQPLFIIDEVDKLKDEVLELFIDLENKLHEKCGFVFLSTPYMQKRMDEGVGRNRRGFTELYSRMKKVFHDLTPKAKEFERDVKAICIANGVTDEKDIAFVMNKCENDFRALTDLINATKAIN